MPRKNALSRAKSSIVTDSLRITQSSGLDVHVPSGLALIAEQYAAAIFTFPVRPVKRRTQTNSPAALQSCCGEV